MEESKMGMNEQNMIISQISCPGGTIYTIVPGDTLFALARRFNTTVQAIQNANVSFGLAETMGLPS